MPLLTIADSFYKGTHYFEMRDLEGNVIEVSEEP
jgi:hypothetical protein